MCLTNTAAVAEATSINVLLLAAVRAARRCVYQRCIGQTTVWRDPVTQVIWRGLRKYINRRLIPGAFRHIRTATASSINNLEDYVPVVTRVQVIPAPEWIEAACPDMPDS